jgi:hypothetical protein
MNELMIRVRKRKKLLNHNRPKDRGDPAMQADAAATPRATMAAPRPRQPKRHRAARGRLLMSRIPWLGTMWLNPGQLFLPRPRLVRPGPQNPPPRMLAPAVGQRPTKNEASPYRQIIRES